MSNQLKDFHHYKGQELTRFEKVERKVMELILFSKVPDSKREDSKIFEFMHAGGVIQIGRLLAQKRKLDVDIAGVTSILHDIYVITTGSYKNHGPEGAKIAQNILKQIGDFSQKEIQIITEAVAHHSEKEIYTDKPFVELVKDADVFECSLYKNAQGFYKIHKPPHIYKEYVNRIKKVRKELGLKTEEVFR